MATISGVSQVSLVDLPSLLFLWPLEIVVTNLSIVSLNVIQ